MPNKKILMWFVLGWLFAVVYSPSAFVGMFMGKAQA
jgi:hypothetical protein